MFRERREWINCVLLEVLENERGSIEVVAWLVDPNIAVLPVARKHMAKPGPAKGNRRDGRPKMPHGSMGIELGRKNLQAAQEATARAKQVLGERGLMKPNSNFCLKAIIPRGAERG